MTIELDIGVEAILPRTEAILLQQGVPPQAACAAELLSVAEDARRELAAVLAPAGVLVGVGRREFADIYAGQGLNAPESPLQGIFPRAEKLSLFAVTCGQAVCDRIGELFRANDFPLGAALDAGASLAADQAAQVAQEVFAAGLADAAGVLRYSPGYCGWHVSGQRALFARLGSGAAGIRLNAGFLMRPLKSVSGVMVAGRPAIHRFDNDYPFCTACTGKECRDRLQEMTATNGEGI